MKHQKPKSNTDPAYEGYSKAINMYPMLKTSNAGRKLSQSSGIPMYQLMRNFANKENNTRRQKEEEERLRADERIAELKQ